MTIVKLVLNIDQELHRRLKVKAAMEGITITKVVTDAIEEYVRDTKTGGAATRVPRKAKS